MCRMIIEIRGDAETLLLATSRIVIFEPGSVAGACFGLAMIADDLLKGVR